MRVVILMPVFAPRRELKGTEPPNVFAGIAFRDVIEMR